MSLLKMGQSRSQQQQRAYERGVWLSWDRYKRYGGFHSSASPWTTWFPPDDGDIRKAYLTDDLGYFIGDYSGVPFSLSSRQKAFQQGYRHMQRRFALRELKERDWKPGMPLPADLAGALKMSEHKRSSNNDDAAAARHHEAVLAAYNKNNSVKKQQPSEFRNLDYSGVSLDWMPPYNSRPAPFLVKS